MLKLASQILKITYVIYIGGYVSEITSHSSS